VPRDNSGIERPRSQFAIQKHWARSLHYDFRLEIGGVLASWAVPKGPSKDPEVRRLAIHVPDHPLDYLLFEGTLPDADYGAGTVIVWDFGEYEPVGPGESDAATALQDGAIHFTLFGKKLGGEWAIFRTKMGRGDRENWLLEKIRDEFAEAGYDPEDQPESALSGKIPSSAAN
jgi:bifunctional non-homologous end joining protein LigD